jgi:hypothetical protein
MDCSTLEARELLKGDYRITIAEQREKATAIRSKGMRIKEKRTGSSFTARTRISFKPYLYSCPFIGICQI